MQNFRALHQPTGRLLHVNNTDFLFFGGTAYLGLLGNKDYIDLYKQGIDKYGLNNGTSRSNNVQLGIYDAVENRMAERFGFDDAAIFSSGYLAAQVSVLSLCAEKNVFYAPDCHPSLWKNGNPNIASQSFEHWAEATVSAINASTEDEFVIVSNALDNLKPLFYNLSVFDAIENNKKVLFILDDSHGIGIVKQHQISSEISFISKRSNFDLVVVASLAKGLGTDAGIIMGSKENITKVKSHPIFMGASPSSPAAMHALLHGETIYQEQLERLQKNVLLFGTLVKDLDMFNYVDNFPVFTSLKCDLSQTLERNKIIISSFPYPLADSPLLNRVVISALHQEKDLSILHNICQSIRV